MTSEELPDTGVWVFPEAPAGELVALAARAEDLGLDEFWVGDEGPARDPFTVLAGAAMVTDRIRLATGITNPYARHPGVAAASMLTVHELSKGRAVLGVGAGGQMSLAPFGIEPDRPLQRVEEFIKIARAVASGRSGAGYSRPDVALDEGAVGVPLPLFIGARGQRLNQLASAQADGAFVAGLPPFRYPEVISWARSERPIDIALYPSVAFSEAAIERHRPEMIWALLDTPPEVRAELDLDEEAVRSAADELRRGDPGPARAVVDDTVLQQVMLVGDPSEVGSALAALVRTHRPSSVGLAILQDDLEEGLIDVAASFAVLGKELGGS
jgi:5,10-methylenetetrahydromethanopterin reductase